jgi:hypothetical protein
MDDTKLYLTDEVAEFLRCSPRTLEGWRSDKRGPDYIRTPAGVRYTGAAVREFLEKATVKVNP